MNMETVYSEESVLITGGMGFIGSNLVRKLVKLGANVTVYDNLDPDSGGNLFNLSDLLDDIEFIQADINDEVRLKDAVAGKKYLFNLAGQMSHLGSMDDPIHDLNINAVGQIKLLEVCRKFNPDVNIVFAGTRQVYGKPQYLPVDEAHLLTPLDNNGVSKRAGEMYHIVYNHVYGISTSVLRMTNVYGPRMRIKDDKLTFIGWWFRQILEGNPIQIYGKGGQIRDLNHVDDVVRALLLCASNPTAQGKIYNLGGKPISLLELARLMVEIHGGGKYELIPFPESRKRIDIGDYYGDYSLIRNEIGWKPEVPLRNGIKTMLEFYYKFKEHYF